VPDPPPVALPSEPHAFWAGGDLSAAEVREAIDIAAPGGGYVLASDHSLHDGIPIDNILEMFRVGAEYGSSFYDTPKA